MFRFVRCGAKDCVLERRGAFATFMSVWDWRGGNQVMCLVVCRFFGAVCDGVSSI